MGGGGAGAADRGSAREGGLEIVGRKPGHFKFDSIEADEEEQEVPHGVSGG